MRSQKNKPEAATLRRTESHPLEQGRKSLSSEHLARTASSSEKVLTARDKVLGPTLSRLEEQNVKIFGINSDTNEGPNLGANDPYAGLGKPEQSLSKAPEQGNQKKESGTSQLDPQVESRLAQLAKEVNGDKYPLSVLLEKQQFLHNNIGYHDHYDLGLKRFYTVIEKFGVLADEFSVVIKHKIALPPENKYEYNNIIGNAIDFVKAYQGYTDIKREYNSKGLRGISGEEFPIPKRNIDEVLSLKFVGDFQEARIFGLASLARAYIPEIDTPDNWSSDDWSSDDWHLSQLVLQMATDCDRAKELTDDMENKIIGAKYENIDKYKGYFAEGVKHSAENPNSSDKHHAIEFIEACQKYTKTKNALMETKFTFSQLESPISEDEIERLGKLVRESRMPQSNIPSATGIAFVVHTYMQGLIPGIPAREGLEKCTERVKASTQQLEKEMRKEGTGFMRWPWQ